ncbi:MAG: NAD(P)H-dependent oxidoreductase subunit E [Proteobacteria bacterium]|nr:NAD(P)H-dependent oxidoreductase subunit E [Pseudomonadota bacterium]
MNIKVKIINELDSKNKYYAEKIKSSQKKYKWTEPQLKHIEEVKTKYPEGKEQSALLEVLHFAQDSFDSWLPVNLMKLVAQTLNIPLIRVEEVVSFYTMFHSEPIGKYYIQVCTHCSCMMNGSSSILQALNDAVGEVQNRISLDGLFTIQEAECLGACVKGPVVVVNGEYHEKMTPEKASALIKELKMLQPSSRG